MIDWVMRMHRVSFRHACEILAKLHPALAAAVSTDTPTATVKLSAGKLRTVQSFSLADGDQQLLDQVIEFYHTTLKWSPEALEYLEQRGLGNPELIAHFQLGYATIALYQSGKDDPVFHPAHAPTPAELDAILLRIIQALMKQLTRSGHLHVEEEEGSGYLGDLMVEGSADSGLGTLQWASCTDRIAFGPNAGRSTLQRHDASRVADTVKPGCVSRQGFSLHAGIRCRADQRRELERLCRYITGPALSHERLARSAEGAAILDGAAVAKILTHLGLCARAPPRGAGAPGRRTRLGLNASSPSVDCPGR